MSPPASATRWRCASSHNTASFVTDQFIRVADAACGTACGADDAYRIRLRETTILAAHNLDGFNTAMVANGVSGHLTIAHNGPHGGLNVNSVALELATGSASDTPDVYCPY